MFKKHVQVFCLWSGTALKYSERNNPAKLRKTIINITGLKIPTAKRQPSWPFTSVAEELNSGLP